MRSPTDIPALALALAAALACAAPCAAERGAPGPAVEALLTGDAPLAPADVEGLLDAAAHRSPGLRQQAIERLVRQPGVAAAPAVARLKSGGLAVQLSCLELLGRWGAPVRDVDPWTAGSIAAALPRLETWAREAAPTAKPRPALEGDALGRALEDLASPDDVRASGALERLAAHGSGVLPRLRELGARALDDRVQQRIAALRYRLAMTPALTVRDPTLPFQLAIASGPSRARIAERALAGQGADARSLLMELVQDGHPLVRETAVKLLRDQGGAADRLAALLDDPDPNVRAALLKELASNPDEQLAARLAAYAGRERDEDLLVHAARALGRLHGAEGVQSMLGLAGHASWRVRAEAADALRTAYRDNKLGTDLRREIAAKLRALLSDPDRFVRAKSIEGVTLTDDAASLEPLLALARAEPTLILPAIDAIAKSPAMRKAAAKTLRELCADARPPVRAAAVKALVESAQAEVGGVIAKLLVDAEREPRLAAALALTRLVERIGDDATARAKADAELQPAREPVKRLAAAPDSGEREAGLRAALALRMNDTVDRPLREMADQDPASLDRIGGELARASAETKRWLLLKVVLAKDLAGPIKASVGAHLITDPTADTRELLWRVVDRDDLGPTLRKAIGEVLSPGSRWRNRNGELLAHLSLTKAASASIALHHYYDVEPAAGETIARAIVDDERAHPVVRANALRKLLGSEAKGRTKLAMRLLSSGQEWAVAPALGWLASGKTARAITEIRLPDGPLEEHWYSSPESGHPPPLPRALPIPLLKAQLKSDGREALYAAHLLALTGDAEGIPLLEAREAADDFELEASALLVDAIVVLDRDDLVPILDRLWTKMKKQSWKRGAFVEHIGLLECPAGKALRRRVKTDLEKEKP